MDKKTLINKILKYQGEQPYILKLKEKAKNETLDSLQLTIADRLLKNDGKNKKVKQKKEARSIIEKQTNLFFPIKVTDEQIISYMPKHFETLPYQLEGIRWLIKPKPTRWLLDEQGLGKTLQCIIATMILGYKINVIICPNFLKYNWLREIEQFKGEAQFINDKTVKNLKQFNIINYESVHKYSKELITNNIDITIVDESQFVKKLDSRRHLYTKAVCNSSKRVWLLTGTAKDNRLFDLFGQLQILRHDLGLNSMYFGQKYCNTNEDNPFDFSGANNLEELHKVLFSTVALRRTKDVLKNVIPDKIPNKVIFYELQSIKRYKQLIKDYIKKTEEPEFSFGGFTHLAEINILKKFLAEEKMQLNKELIDNILEENPNDKIVLFSNHTSIINQYHEIYKNISIIHNGETVDKKTTIEQFEKDPNIRLGIMQFQNSHAGLNFQFANHTIMNEEPQTPGIELQAKDRTHRIGQSYMTNYYYPRYANTIDETLYLLFQEEHKVSKNVIDGENNEIKLDMYKKLHAGILRAFLN